MTPDDLDMVTAHVAQGARRFTWATFADRTGRLAVFWPVGGWDVTPSAGHSNDTVRVRTTSGYISTTAPSTWR
jgi:hypothetical protein